MKNMAPNDLETAARVQILKASRPTKTRWFIQLILALLVLGLGYAGYQTLVNTRPSLKVAAPAETVYPVRSIVVRRSDYQPRIHLYGQIISGRNVAIRPLVSGEIIAIHPKLRDNGTVNAGEELLQIDDFEYRGALLEARTNLTEAKARLLEAEGRSDQERDGFSRAQEQLELAKRDHARALRLRAARTLSEKAIEDRALVVSQREQAVEQRKNNLAIEEARSAQLHAAIERFQWQVEKAERALKNTRLIAPFTAHVSDVNAEIGRWVSSNDAIAILRDSERQEVAFTLSDQQYGRLITPPEQLIGRLVGLSWQVGDQPLAFTATVVRVGAEINAATGGIPVFAELSDAQATAHLRPGAFVDVEIEDRLYQDVFKLPQTALYGTDLIYQIQDGRLVRRQVQIIGHDGDHLLAIGDIQDGATILSSRISEVGPGLLIEEIE